MRLIEVTVQAVGKVIVNLDRVRYFRKIDDFKTQIVFSDVEYFVAEVTYEEMFKALKQIK